MNTKLYEALLSYSPTEVELAEYRIAALERIAKAEKEFRERSKIPNSWYDISYDI